MKRITPQNLLTTIAPFIPQNPTIVEAGAFRGHDTVKLATHWPQATLHAFEPVPKLYQLLKSTTTIYPQISCYQQALADSNGTHTFWPSYHPKKPHQLSQAGSLRAPKERLQWSNIPFGTPITVSTITLDTWAIQANIDQIDLLWLDTQGYELPIMQASPLIFSTVKALWVEVHFVQAYEGQARYPQVSAWLQAQGFTLVGKDFDDTTSWFFGTILAVRK